MPTTHADRARFAHQALRLRESGIDSEAQIRALAARAPAARLLDPSAQADQEIQAAGFDPHAGLALAVACLLDDDLPGPTDRPLVERVMAYDLSDIWRVWDESVEANLEELLPDDELAAWRESVARDEAAYQERLSLMLETGDWPVHPAFGHDRHTEGAANALYDVGRQGFLDGSIDWDTATIKVLLVDSAVYTVNLATHQFVSSIASVVASSPALTTKTVAAGVADGDDAVMAAVTGAQSEALILAQTSAVGGGADVATSAQRLIGYIDTATGLPVTPNGGNITAAWDNGTNRIFKL